MNYIGNIKWAKSIQKEAKGDKQFFIDKILKYEFSYKDTNTKPQIKNCFYTIRRVQIRNNKPPLVVKDVMSVYDFRKRFNIITSLNRLEMDFLEKHSDDWKYDTKKKLIVPRD